MLKYHQCGGITMSNLPPFPFNRIKFGKSLFYDKRFYCLNFGAQDCYGISYEWCGFKVEFIKNR